MQEAKIAAANKEYDNYAHINAIQTYEGGTKGYKSVPFFKTRKCLLL
jgi:hypothetical protein